MQAQQGEERVSSWRRQGRSLNHLYPLGWSYPWVRRAEPAEALRLDGLRIVERADADGAHARHRFHRPGDLRAALGAELEAQPAPGLVRMVLVGLELAAKDLHLRGVEVGAEAERAPGAALAEGAAAHRVARRLAFDAVAHRAADAPAFPRHPCHTPYPFSRNAIASSTSMSLAAS